MAKSATEKIFKLNFIFALWLLMFFFSSLTVYAAENKITVSIDKSEYSEGESIELRFNLKGEEKASAFLIEAEYPEGISYSNNERSSIVKNGYNELYDSGSKVSFVYTFKDGVMLSPSEDILVLKFKVSESIQGENEIKISVKGLLGENGEKLAGDSSGSLKFIANPPKEEVKVTGIFPSNGALNPAFSSDIHSYKMYVPYSVDSISFDIEYTGEAKASVNRKNLGSGGSVSEFIITVTPSEGEKIIYTVSVTRGEYVRPSKGSSANSGSSSQTSSALSDNSESVPQEGTDIIESSISKPDTENKTSTSIVVLEEPAKVETTESNSFTAFLLGAGTMVIGIIIGLLCLLIFKKVKGNNKD